jgi:hypothetical protein
MRPVATPSVTHLRIRSSNDCDNVFEFIEESVGLDEYNQGEPC